MHRNNIQTNVNSQKEWRKLIIDWLNRIEKNQNAIADNQVKIREQIATLKVKAGIWGMIGGFGPAALIIILWLLRGL